MENDYVENLLQRIEDLEYSAIKVTEILQRITEQHKKKITDE